MKNKHIKSVIRKSLKSGKSKNEVYEEYSQSMDDDHLRRVLASIPSPDTKKTFILIHSIICWIWVLFFITELLGSFGIFINFDLKVLITLVATTYLLIEVWKFNGDAYLPGIIWMIFGVFNTFKDMGTVEKDDVDYDALIMLSWIYIALFLTNICLMLIVRKNVFGYYNWFKPSFDEEKKMKFQKD